MRQFFIDTSAGGLPARGSTVTLSEDESHHLFTVLRGGRDAVLNLVDGRGHRLTGRAAGKQGKQAQVRIETVSDDPAEQYIPRLVLACAVVKGKRFEWALEKAVELGAHRIMPLRCEHGVVDPRQGKRERWLNVMKSAVKQCGRSWLPTLAEPCAVADAPLGNAACYFGAAPWETPDKTVRPWTELLAERPVSVPADLVFLVGPEGGWSAAEMAVLVSKADPLSLGPHVLRAETAAAAGLTAMQAVRQAWRGEA